MFRLAPLALLALLLIAAPARGDGLPVLGVDVGGSGVTVAGHPARYVTLNVPGGTVVAQIERDGGRVLRTRRLHRKLTVPAAAYDGPPPGCPATGARWRSCARAARSRRGARSSCSSTRARCGRGGS